MNASNTAIQLEEIREEILVLEEKQGQTLQEKLALQKLYEREARLESRLYSPNKNYAPSEDDWK